MRRRRAKEEDAHGDGPSLWLRLALEEVAMRSRVGTGGGDDALERMLEMQARLKTAYPAMPFALKSGFNARLSASGYSEDGWNAAIAWLEATDRF